MVMLTSQNCLGNHLLEAPRRKAFTARASVSLLVLFTHQGTRAKGTKSKLQTLSLEVQTCYKSPQDGDASASSTLPSSPGDVPVFKAAQRKSFPEWSLNQQTPLFTRDPTILCGYWDISSLPRGIFSCFTTSGINRLFIFWTLIEKRIIPGHLILVKKI